MSKGSQSFALDFRRPKLFSSAFTRRITSNDGEIYGLTANDVVDTGLTSTSSFRYDPPGSGLRSTQQLPVDWSRFENHTFFNSAEVNVNVSFDKIINEFPFDGSREEYEDFVDSLSGFEKWVLDRFPRNMGYLIFSGSYIPVNGFAGSTHNSIAKNDTGILVTDPDDKSFTVEMHLFLTGTTNSNQTIFQYLSRRSDGDYGFTIGLNSTASLASGTLFMAVSSGSSYMSSSITVDKGTFNHLAFTVDKNPGVNTIFIYASGNLVASSSTTVEFGKFGFTSESLYIGSGSTHTFGAAWTPAQTFFGYMDELRYFHSVRDAATLKKNALRNVFASDDLILYYKFNEPTGSFGDITSIALDSSGNSLHSTITNFVSAFRLTGSLTSKPVSYESGDFNPILFPMFEGMVTLNTDLLSSASLYDAANPNLITRLVPKHYLQEGQIADALNTEEGDIGDSYTGSDLPGSGKLGSAQLLSAFLYVWAKQFDEIKIFADHMPDTSFVSYDDQGSAADQFLPRLFRHYGLDAPTFFNNSTIHQFVNSEDVGVNHDVSQQSMQSVQNKIWRRILVNMGDILKSKGTIHSVKALIRAVGVNPDSTVRIREYGGATIRNLEEASQFKVETSTLLDMSGTLASVASSLDAQGVPSLQPFVRSGFLSASRIEVGFPTPVGTFVNKPTFPVHGISNNLSDGLFTSGSWTAEATYRFGVISSASHPLTQSMMRICSTGSVMSGHNLLCNLIACSGSDDADSKLKLFSVHVSSSLPPLLELVLTGVNVFDGHQWSISFGRSRSDEIEVPGSSSWFIRAGRQNMGEIVETFTTSSFFVETADGTNAFQNQSSVFNASGAFITIGSQSLAAGTLFMNSSSITGSEPKMTTFSGKVGHIRFWSKALNVVEWEEHVRNFKSLGVKDPLVNFNFSTQPTGAFQRLRLDASTDQITTASNASGRIEIFDFSQNGLHMSGSGFEVSKSVVVPETFRYSFISPHFDEASSDNKVRVRGYTSNENVARFGGATSPVHQISPSERPADDVRFSIDFSAITALNEDIMRMFATLDSLDNALGDPALAYSDDYPSLAEMRDVYFRRLTGIVNFRGFFEYFKWFDSAMGTFISQLLPRKTKFLGTNFVIESHILERNKVRYSGEESNIVQTSRRASTTTAFEDSTMSVKG